MLLNDEFNLHRFVKAQEQSYEQALREIRNGQKVSHWMWYIFPQLKGLGHSYNSDYYGIASREEATAYLEHPLLGLRLVEITSALLPFRGDKTAREIFGRTDAQKLKSSMTLFALTSGNSLFDDILYVFYNHTKSNPNYCRRTKEMLEQL